MGDADGLKNSTNPEYFYNNYDTHQNQNDYSSSSRTRKNFYENYEDPSMPVPMQGQDINNFSSKPPLLTEKPLTEENIGQKYKSHKDAWNSGKAEYQPINYLQTGPTQNNNNNSRPFTGIRHITPVGDPVGLQNRT